MTAPKLLTWGTRSSRIPEIAVQYQRGDARFYSQRHGNYSTLEPIFTFKDSVKRPLWKGYWESHPIKKVPAAATVDGCEVWGPGETWIAKAMREQIEDDEYSCVMLPVPTVNAAEDQRARQRLMELISELRATIAPLFTEPPE